MTLLSCARPNHYRWLAALWLAGLGCAPYAPPSVHTVPKEVPPAAAHRRQAYPDGWFLHETPVPVDAWRGHRLAGCPPEGAAPSRVERVLDTCGEYFLGGSGSDAIVMLEMELERGLEDPLIQLTLGQLYLLAGQGDPSLLPKEGPAADVGDWDRNRRRLLERARVLLEAAGRSRPQDAAVDYLLADVARAGGDVQEADERASSGQGKCTGGRSFRILQLYQQLSQHPPRFLGGPAPVYPAAAVAAGVSGEVVLDLLISPAAQVRQAVAVATPDSLLSEAAQDAMLQGEFEAGRVGKYPVWSWLRVTTAFRLTGEG